MSKNMLFSFITASAVLLTQANAAQFAPLPQGDLPMTGLQMQARLTDNQGNIHTRYVQTFAGLPVFGQQVITHEYAPRLQSAEFPLPQLTGTWLEGVEEDLNTTKAMHTMAPQAALDHFKTVFSADRGQSVYENEEVEEVIFIDAEKTARRAVSLSFFVDSPEGGLPAWPHYVVDGATWEVLKYWDGLTTEDKGTGPGGNGKTGHYEYGMTPPYDAFAIDIRANTCTMQNKDAYVVHMKGGRFGNKGAFQYSCDKQKEDYRQANDAVNGAFSPLNDAYAFGNTVIEMYETWYQRKPLPIELVLRVHYAKDFANAFWNGRVMTFGDGNTDMFPLTTMDVTAHEISHGVTQYLSDLEYTDMSGGLNESFSDMGAKAAEFYFFGKHDWMIGSKVYKEKGTAFRYMDDPTRDGQSIGNAGDFVAGMDPHLSSGVFNKAFYVLATTPGWDTKKAFDVMYQANANYWTPTSNFADAGWGAVVSAHLLGYSYLDVVSALKEVGIDCNMVTEGCHI